MNSYHILSPIWSFTNCPEPPNWTLDWSALQAEFDWLKSLENCPQDPRYHAEGDVLTHTRLVCEALISLPAWRELPASERAILFAAALLHDVAKPAATKIEADGSISSKGHVRQGAKMTRQILYSMNVPFQQREAVVNLVQYGSLPLWFWDKENPQASVIKASQIIRCDLLALLAEADVRGRHSNDREQLLERIDFFREFCQENDCFEHPRHFASHHSRFVYFQKENGNPNYTAFDDTRFEVVLMSGLPASGKNHWICEHLPDWTVISLDELRRLMNISPEDNQGAVGDRGREIAREYMRSAKYFVWNATNISRQLRSSLVNLFSAYGGRIRIVYLEAPWEELLERNNSRHAKVPEKVIERMCDRLDIPDITEAHVVDWVYS
ncbi:AAA family ATPase [Argonema galeatum]|uniref:AAA family ATPase n=1 Tax=Argonema galeatum TaxID=2942762 RepID=UPI002012C0A0|nr:AAA family ATPase [Argonema galeatum]MCL1468090.1 AAA family ATPase [Argonema galeatum A003/A1]